MWTDKLIIKGAIWLLNNGLINKTQFDSLAYDPEKMQIINDTHFPVDFCEDGCAYIRQCGAYPFKVKGLWHKLNSYN